MNWHDKSLKIFSLTNTETVILNVLAEAKSVQEIAKSSHLSRTGINYALKTLVSKELVISKRKGKRRIYVAISLEDLSKRVKATLDEIEIANAEKKGAKVKLTKKDEFIIHIGPKEIIPAYKRIAAENKNERIRAIQHHRSWLEIIKTITPKQLIEFNEAIKTNHIILEGMLNESAYKEYEKEIASDPDQHLDVAKSLEGRMADYTVFPDDMFNQDAEIWIFRTTTLIINWKEGVAIEITNANMTGFLRDMFEYVKAGGRKIDHAKSMRSVLSKDLP
jgi:sugar-specific transcriptional regulator TrmB